MPTRHCILPPAVEESSVAISMVGKLSCVVTNPIKVLYEVATEDVEMFVFVTATVMELAVVYTAFLKVRMVPFTFDGVPEMVNV